jgi:guanylate kinase
MTKGSILVLSGPSGCGKSSLLKNLYSHINNYYFSISTTTRTMRDGEENEKDYFFVSKDEFEKDIEDGQFLEYAKVHDNYYGTSLKPIKKALDKGQLVIFDIDVQGHESLRKIYSQDTMTSVFITTPSLQELEHRLNSRGTDSSEVILKRVENAKEEINRFDEYDYLLINDNLDEASESLLAIVNAMKIKSSAFDKDTILNNW